MSDIFISNIRSVGDLAGVFEHDGEVGYFYLYRTNGASGSKMLDAIKVSVGPAQYVESDIRIDWCDKETIVCLTINSVTWAAFECVSGEKYGGNFVINLKADIPSNIQVRIAGKV